MKTWLPLLFVSALALPMMTLAEDPTGLRQLVHVQQGEGSVLANAQPMATRAGCAPTDKAQTEVVEVMRGMYAALLKDDLAGFQGRVTPDYYAFDGGMRFTAESLVNVIAQAHAKGTRFEWSVTGPEVHVTCNAAWITYVNRGAVEEASGKVPVTWLESAILQYMNGEWRIRFFHSTRARNPP